MAATQYTYSIQNDFPNHKVATDRLAQEIQASAIIIALDRIDTAGDACDIWFKDELLTGDKTLLDGLVAAHSGEPLPSLVQPVSIDKATSSVQSAVIYNVGYSPDPSNYPDGTSPSAIDGENNQCIRGQVLTDEGSYRDDFPGTSMSHDVTGTMTFTQGSTKVTGTGTAFRTDLDTDDHIWLKADGENYGVRVGVVNSDTDLDLDDVYGGTGGTGTGTGSEWLLRSSGDGSIAVADSKITLSAGLQANGMACIARDVDYLPMRMAAIFRVTRRDANTRVSVGFVDTIVGPPDYGDAASVFIEGTDAHHVTFTTVCQGMTEETEVSIPAGDDTSTEAYYEVELTQFRASLLINGNMMATHRRHVPRNYALLKMGAAVFNTDVVSTATEVECDVVACANHDIVEIGGHFMAGAPMPIRSSEDAHNICGKLVTETTAADQVILQYTVPQDRVMYATGYSISAPDNSVSADPFKLGRGDISDEPDAPGIVDGNLLRLSRLPAGVVKDEDWSANPRLLGSGGDVIKMAVTPTGPSPSEWRATLDFVLR